MTDQQRADHVGFAGNDVVETLNLDRLAEQSVRFDHAFVANPICMPNRASIFTGRVPSAHGTRHNGIALDWRANTFARVLRRAGYNTAYFGKCHLQNMGLGGGIMRNFLGEVPSESAHLPVYGDGWDEWEIAARYVSEDVVVPPDFYGFDHVELAVNHADFVGGHYYRWLLDKGADPTKIQGPQNALPYEHATTQLYRTATPEDLYSTTYVTERTVAFLESKPRKPFLAVCSYPDPHHPFTPPGSYFEKYAPDEMPLPPTFDDPHEHSFPYYRRLKRRPGQLRTLVAPFAPTEAQLKDMLAKQYGSIAMIDDGVGRVLDAFEAAGAWDNTIVIFTSDHGDMFGDHGMMLKGNMHYEGCLRVSLTIKAPGTDPGSSRALVSSLDLAQTILELTECEPYYGMQGTSLVPLLTRNEESVRDHVYVEEEQMTPNPETRRPTNMRTLITEEGRITVYLGHESGELFDLQGDPSELHNLFEQGEHAAFRRHMSERLTQAMMRYSTPPAPPTHFT